MADETAAASGGAGSAILKKIFGRGDIFFALGIVGIITLLIIPVPPMMMDMLLSISITFSVLILMTVLFISRPLEFNAFPTVLLVAAVLRLSLNIASTRLILSQGHTGPSAAGNIIEAFGGFVMEGSVVIGAIVFAILTIINFVVITKGSGRIAEVAARFSLDAMPGKQMAIDADLSAGLIDEDTAKQRRKDLEDENTFFGAMDGASKFVRGDAVAGLLITIVNLVAGMVIGIVERDLTFSEAITTYTMLTIGDGLVSQIPALVVSMSAGMLVSKGGVTGTTDQAVFGQLSRFPVAMGLSCALLVVLAITPGMPAIPFLLLATLLGGIGFYIASSGEMGSSIFASGDTEATKKGDAAQTEAPAKSEDQEIAETLQIDSLRLELGYGLLPLINYQKGHRLTEQIKALRKQLARDFGFVMPAVRIQDNMQLGTNQYAIRVKDIECGGGEVNPDKLLVMDPKGAPIAIPGEDTTEPAFGLPAKWVEESQKEEALFHNYTVVDPPTVLTTHLTEIIKENITELLSYSETQKLLDDLGEEHRKLVEDTVPSQVSISGLQRLLQNLLAEMVSIRDLPTILEAASEATRSTQNVNMITEHVRSRLSRQISYANTGPDGYIPILALSPEWEKIFAQSLVGKGEDKQLSIPPSKLQEFISVMKKTYEKHALKGEMPVLLTSPAIRPYVRSIVERFRSITVVMSQNEIHPKAKIKTLGQV